MEWISYSLSLFQHSKHALGSMRNSEVLGFQGCLSQGWTFEIFLVIKILFNPPLGKPW